MSHISLDKRLIDYYFVVTASDRAKSGTNQRLTSEPLAPKGATKAIHAKFAWKPKIVDRYPSRDHADTPLRAWVARSSLPRGVRARTRPPPPRFTTFIGWNVDGCKLYGAVIEVYEKLKIRNQNEKVYMPKALGFISHYPYFYAFDVFLRCLWHSIPKEIIRLEDLLVHYFYDIPVPAPGKKIAYDLGKLKVLLTQRNEFDIPIPELPQDILFSRLSEDRICWILRYLLLGHRVIFVASQEGELTIVNETFSALLFPLRWCYLYVPIASKRVALALASHEGPFMIGLPLFLYKRDEVKHRLPRDALIVEMDHNRILAPVGPGGGARTVLTGPPTPNLPESILPELRKGIHALARILTMPVDDDTRPNRNQILAALRVCFNVVRYTISHCAAYLESRDGPPAGEDGPERPVSEGRPRGDEREEPREYSDEDSEFFELFGRTAMYRKFVEYYDRVNPDDGQFRKIYQFFKTHEALGKDFARPAAGSMNVSFDRRVYNSKTFVVDRKLITKLEGQYAARRRTRHGGGTAGATAGGGGIVLIPREFAPDDHVMAFLRRHMLSHGGASKTAGASTGPSSPQNVHPPRGSDVTEPNASGGDYDGDGHRVVSHGDDPDATADGKESEVDRMVPEFVHSNSGSFYDEGDTTENMMVDFDGFHHFENARNNEYDSMSDWSLSEDSGADIDDIEAWETESVLSDVGASMRGDGGAHHRNRASNTSIRSMQRFRHLNEFEVSEEEYRNFRECEKDHNKTVQNVSVLSTNAFLATVVGQDLFTREIMEAWASNERNALKKTRSFTGDRGSSASPRANTSARSVHSNS